MSNDAAHTEVVDALVRAHYDRLSDFVYRQVRSREVAEDIVQDIFVRTLEKDWLEVEDPLAILRRDATTSCRSRSYVVMPV